MKKLVIWLLSVLLIVVAVDLLFGLGARYYLRTHSLKGDYRSADYLIKDSVDELVVLGSSVALNSINTKAISDSLGISAFNGGSNGQNFPYFLTMLEIIATKPGIKTVILGMKESSLYGSGLGSRYNFLVPYYKTGLKGIDERLENNSKLDKFFLRSSLYRYNTIWFRILLYMFIEPGIQGERGFIAKDVPAVFPHKLTPVSEPYDTVTAERAHEFEQFVRICNEHDIRLIVCIPPRFENEHLSAAETFLRNRAQNDDFELWYDLSSTPLSTDSTLFYDDVHLNYLGAKIYTDTIISRLKKQ
ncbi:MAG: hypothetical protein HDS72_08600 [Bacteroidales bacterium]|nr:hypothetical protein [Bacteroidales bacterium]